MQAREEWSMFAQRRLGAFHSGKLRDRARLIVARLHFSPTMIDSPLSVAAYGAKWSLTVAMSLS